MSSRHAVISQKSFIKRHPDQWSVAVTYPHAQRRPPRQFGSRSVNFLPMLEDLPELGVLRFPEGAVSGLAGRAFTASGQIVAETTWYGQDLRDQNLGAVSGGHRLDGTCLSLVTEFAADNYGHYVLDGLSRIGIAERAGHPIGDFDHIYLNRPVSTSAKVLLNKLGVRPEQCVWAEDEPAITAETLFVTTFPGTKRNYARIVPETLQKATGVVPAPTRRLYIPRAGTRKIANESEIGPVLAAFGIETYDFRECDNEPDFFRSARLIIGAHGAGLTNIAFCQPGTKILEIVPSDHAYPYFYTVAESAGLDYAYIVGQSTGSRRPGTFGPSPYDFMIDVETFRDAIGQLVAEMDAEQGAL